MPEYVGTTRVPAQLTPLSTENDYPLFDTIHGKGGVRTVGTTADLNTIFDRLRVRGMMVYVSGVSAYYALIGTTANSGWTTEFQMGTGTNILPLNNTFTGQNTFNAGVSFDSVVDFTSGMELRSYGLTVISSDAYQNTTFEKNGQTVLQTGTGVEIPSTSSSFYVATGSTFDGTVNFNNTIQGTTASFSRLLTAIQGISAPGATFGKLIVVGGEPRIDSTTNGLLIGRTTSAGIQTEGGAGEITFWSNSNSIFTANSDELSVSTPSSFSGLITATQGITSSSLNTTRIQAYNGSTFGSDLYVGATLTVAGNFIVNGTTTTINATTITVDDKLIELAHSPSGATGNNAAVDGGGIQLNSTQGNKTFTWVNATGAWTSSEDLNLVTGKVYEINGTTVLSSSALGTGITASSLQSVGTIGTGVWQGTQVGVQYGGTGLTGSVKGDLLIGSNTANLYTRLPISTTSGQFLGTDGSDIAWRTISIGNASGTSVASLNTGMYRIQDATSSLKGLASFDSFNFTVTSGAVTIAAIDGGSYT